jgi:hypothetical protein
MLKIYTTVLEEKRKILFMGGIRISFRVRFQFLEKTEPFIGNLGNLKS